MDKKKEDLKNYVEDKIKKYTLYAKNFSVKELERVDEYCKLHFGNDRKKMILSLITMIENNTMIDTLNDKINLIGENLYNEINNMKIILDKLVKPTDDKEKESDKKTNRVSWKGFSK